MTVDDISSYNICMKKQTQKCGLEICGNYINGKCLLEEIEINKWGTCANLWIGVSPEDSEEYMKTIQKEFVAGIVALAHKIG